MTSQSQSALEFLKTVNIPEMEENLKNLKNKLEIVSTAYKNDIDVLRSTIRLAGIVQNGKPKVTRAKPEKKEPKKMASVAGDSLADRVANYLVAAGPSKVAAIQVGLNHAGPAAIYAVLNGHPHRFVKEGFEWRVKSAASRLQES